MRKKLYAGFIDKLSMDSGLLFENNICKWICEATTHWSCLQAMRAPLQISDSWRCMHHRGLQMVHSYSFFTHKYRVSPKIICLIQTYSSYVKSVSTLMHLNTRWRHRRMHTAELFLSFYLKTNTLGRKLVRTKIVHYAIFSLRLIFICFGW